MFHSVIFTPLANRKGVTLIELLIAIAIVGILVASLYPSYLDQVESTRRKAASGALLQLANALERFYTLQSPSTYMGAADDGGGGRTDVGPPAIFDQEAPIDTDAKFYDLTIQAATADTYEVRAVPKNGQEADRCGTLWVDHTGAKGAIDTGGNAVTNCWDI